VNGINDQYDDNFDESTLDLGSDGTVQPEPTEPPTEEPQAPATEQPTPDTAPADEPADAGQSVTPDTKPADEEPQQDERGAIYLPKKRFDEVVSQRNEALLERDTLAEQVKLLQAMVRQTQNGAPQQQQQATQQQAPQTNDNADKMRQLRRIYNQSLIDGDMDRADEVMEAMDYLRRQQIEREVVERATQNARSITADEADQREYYTRLEKYVEKYPAFDEKSPYFDSELSAKAFNVGKALIQSGMSRTQALEELANMFGPVAEQRVAALAPPKPAAPQPTQPLNRAPTKTGTQPPAIHTTGGTGKAAPKYDTSNMTIEDFERLSPEEIAKILEAS
jgi:hypothetical protein